MDWTTLLADTGLVPVRLGKDELGGGAVWWIGRERAEELISLGKAESVPLPTEEDNE
jgi:hypothetical protein